MKTILRGFKVLMLVALGIVLVSCALSLIFVPRSEKPQKEPNVIQTDKREVEKLRRKILKQLQRKKREQPATNKPFMDKGPYP